MGEEKKVSKEAFMIRMLSMRQEAFNAGAANAMNPLAVQARMAEIEMTISQVYIAEHNNIRVTFLEDEEGDLCYEMSERQPIGFLTKELEVKRIEVKMPEVRPQSDKEKLQDLAYQIAVLTNPQLFGTTLRDEENQKEIEKKLEELKKEMGTLL